MDEEAAIIATLEQMGEDEVRRRLATNQFSLVDHGRALRWIEEIDRASAKESEQRKDDIARSAKKAAWTAATAAIIAAIISIIGAFISWSRPHP